MDQQDGRAAGIFISYRRGDAAGHAGRLYDRLVDAFGKQPIFMDVDSIGLGLDFNQALEEAVGSCVVMLVLIGPGWIVAQNDRGERRLEDPSDYVRMEIQTALNRDVPVIPLLVGGAALPSRNELPDPLRALVARQALALRDETFRSDVEILVSRLGPLVQARSNSRSEADSQHLRDTPAGNADVRPDPDARAAVLESFAFLRNHDKVWLWPDIPEERLRVAAKAAAVPDEEEILVVISIGVVTKFDALLLGTTGMYLHKRFDTKTLPYSVVAAAPDISVTGVINRRLRIGSYKWNVDGIWLTNPELAQGLRQLAGRLRA